MSRVLIVEDDKDIADLIAHYLRKAGHAVETLGSGALRQSERCALTRIPVRSALTSWP